MNAAQLLPFLALSAVAALALQDEPALQDAPEPARPQKQHEWLQQLVGEWTVTFGHTTEAGDEAQDMEGTETVRSIGDLWILAEGKASFGGTPFTSILTLGYDPKEKAFVGTWIDSVQTRLWTYRGTLDDSKKVLTLETEGPNVLNPDETSQYRDVIELKNEDHRILTSSILGEDGTWTTFMRAEYRRKEQ